MTMEAVEFIRKIQKMCTGTKCDVCPLRNKNGCNVCYAEDPVESVRIVEEWEKEHPEEAEQEQQKPERERKKTGAETEESGAGAQESGITR